MKKPRARLTEAALSLFHESTGHQGLSRRLCCCLNQHGPPRRGTRDAVGARSPSTGQAQPGQHRHCGVDAETWSRDSGNCQGVGYKDVQGEPFIPLTVSGGRRVEDVGKEGLKPAFIWSSFFSTC